LASCLVGWGLRTSGSTDLDVKGSDANVLASLGDVLSCQHGGVGGGLITVGLDFHTTSHTDDGFPSAGVVNPCQPRTMLAGFNISSH